MHARCFSLVNYDTRQTFFVLLDEESEMAHSSRCFSQSFGSLPELVIAHILTLDLVQFWTSRAPDSTDPAKRSGTFRHFSPASLYLLSRIRMQEKEGY